jgi:hypothetical protein
MKKIVCIAWLLLLAAAIFQAVSAYGELPGRIVTHFDMQGRPNGWMNKGFFYFAYSGLLLVSSVLPMMLVLATGRLFPNKVSVPRKDYWLATDARRKEAISISAAMAAGVGSANAVLLMQILHVILVHARAASAGPVEPEPVDAMAIAILLAPFLAIMAISITAGMTAFIVLPRQDSDGAPTAAFRDQWMWNRECRQVWMAGIIILSIVLSTGLLPILGLESLYFLLLALAAPLQNVIYGFVERKVQKVRAELSGHRGEMCECVVVDGKIQAPGVAVLNDAELILRPIVGEGRTVPLQSIRSIRETWNMFGKGFVWKTVIILDVDGIPRLAFAIPAPVARRWARKLARVGE